jgi:hypothetical protein
MERVAPPQVNYDNVLPLAIESRSNRREFLPVNGQTFSNHGGSTIVRIDVNADSMLDATHSYLECNLQNEGGADTFLAPNGFGPSWIQRLRIESGGVVLEDINEYSRLYAMLVLNQCPQEYVKNNMALLGMYQYHGSCRLKGIDAATSSFDHCSSGGGSIIAAAINSVIPDINELHYNMSAQCKLIGIGSVANVADQGENQPSAFGLAGVHSSNRLANGASLKMCIPLVSGFLNMDKYIPLVMMNAGFTIELTLCSANRIGITQTETAAIQGAIGPSIWNIAGVKYVAHLIDLDRTFYDSLRMVMESSGGVLQLAGQSYRHFSGVLPAQSGGTITLPARVKSVKSIFGTFINNAQMGVAANYDTSVFQSGNITSFRFEIGSVRYPQTDVVFGNENILQQSQREAELEKAFGKIGDYQHQKAYSAKHTINKSTLRDGQDSSTSALSAFFIGYDFEAFQRVALEAGINTADRSLPINCIIERPTDAESVALRADFFVLVDAIFFINLDGTASVSY